MASQSARKRKYTVPTERQEGILFRSVGYHFDHTTLFGQYLKANIEVRRPKKKTIWVSISFLFSCSIFY